MIHSAEPTKDDFFTGPASDTFAFLRGLADSLSKGRLMRQDEASIVMAFPSPVALSEVLNAVETLKAMTREADRSEEDRLRRLIEEFDWNDERGEGD